MGNYDQLLASINEGLLEKKGKEVVNVDLRKLDYAACDCFIICHGDSATQVRSLADSVVDNVEEKLKIKVSHREGLENAQWILLDYGSMVVHIFQKEAREYYRLEELWGDADMTMIRDE
ncbi:MAG: ribosome silencing factor [Bacteroidales bacterium]|nr:ribosome silencing factor [Bacteroidales bacterium]